MEGIKLTKSYFKRKYKFYLYELEGKAEYSLQNIKEQINLKNCY